MGDELQSAVIIFIIPQRLSPESVSEQEGMFMEVVYPQICTFMLIISGPFLNWL